MDLNADLMFAEQAIYSTSPGLLSFDVLSFSNFLIGMLGSFLHFSLLLSLLFFIFGFSR